jgi:hypothetical protein
MKATVDMTVRVNVTFDVDAKVANGSAREVITWSRERGLTLLRNDLQKTAFTSLADARDFKVTLKDDA